MATVSDLTLRDRLWYRTYRFRRAKQGPLTVVAKDTSDMRISLVTSAGLHQRDDMPFAKEKGGDWSWRIVPGSVSPADLVSTHPSRSWDRTGIGVDANVAFPIDRLHELYAAGRIGPPAPRHVSFQGSILAPGRLVGRSAPEMADLLLADGVDGVVLTPV